MKSNKHLIIIISLGLILLCFISRGQFVDCASGLMQAPSAEMEPSGTFMITNNYLNQHALSPTGWGYDTFGYGISIVILPRIEIGYVMTLIDGKRRTHPTERDMIMINQDRHFYGKVQLLREGDFGKSWIPSLAVGISDPTTGDPSKESGIDYSDFDVSGNGNGFFSRYYIVATKHFNTKVGSIGAHLGYQYNKRTDLPVNGPCAAIDWRPVWLQKTGVVSAKFIAEYDSRTLNLGLMASIWRNHFDIMFELMALRWVNFGVRYKLSLKP